MPEPIKFIIDGQQVEAAPGQTILQAALEAGIYIPYLCYFPNMEPYGALPHLRRRYRGEWPQNDVGIMYPPRRCRTWWWRRRTSRSANCDAALLNS